MTTASDPWLTVDITADRIDTDRYLTDLQDSAHGALSMFQGRVRNHDREVPGRDVTAIEYQAHPHAAEILRKELLALIGDSVAVELPRLRVTAVHRVGLIPVGEVALLVAIGSPHRQPGMALVPAIVERIKETLPVWKRQLLEGGDSQWSNLP